MDVLLRHVGGGMGHLEHPDIAVALRRRDLFGRVKDLGHLELHVGLTCGGVKNITVLLYYCTGTRLIGNLLIENLC